MSALLEVRNLSAVFPTRAGDVAAVRDLSYQLGAGASLAIVGESGSGKSVSALSLLGLVPAPGKVVGGEVFFEGRDLLGMSEKQWRKIRGRDIAMVFQDPMTSLNPVLTIGYQLMEALRWHRGAGNREARRQVTETLALVGIPDAERRLDDFPHQFSGGQRQRIMLAMAIACRPSLLIADEPTTALDVTIQAQIVELIAELRHRLDMAVLWITHDLALIASVVDEVAVMYAGTIVEHGPVAAIFGKPRHPYTIGLLRSMPRFDAAREHRLTAIEGMPPDLARLPRGCAFAPRCSRVVERCRAARPALDAPGQSHRVACWRADGE